MNRQHWKVMIPYITAFVNGEKIERRGAVEPWVEADDPLFHNPSEQYRIAPRTIRIGAFDVPEPYRGEMEFAQQYYMPSMMSGSWNCACKWENNHFHAHRMLYGQVHLTPEAAALHGKALASLTAGEEVMP
jgi:hypothetical protein